MRVGVERQFVNLRYKPILRGTPQNNYLKITYTTANKFMDSSRLHRFAAAQTICQ